MERTDHLAHPRSRVRRLLVGAMFTLLVIALLPFLVLCLVFCLKLFLAAVILVVVALLLVAGALAMLSVSWLITRAATRRSALRACGRWRPEDGLHPSPAPVGDQHT
jgi:hypothetical protein